ncbi:hypothetical protein [Neorhodopirellula pilleata]|uniref:Uncharacterized protein n=1 Tax=Neorhodopirellula pilleata TaxID=2714738 RepID=A0A5C5ZK73_9BACT|nr:hypothetical protein [Neorhodopirellula pilleata]TWT87844.1 hypothetical protein Pla100_58830 [Neorhodopirellula pilleata]
MIHYICDRCQRSIDPDEGPRYVIRIDVDVIAEDGDETNSDALMCDDFADDEAVDYLSDLNDTLETEAHHSFLGDEDDDHEQSLDYLNELLCRGDDSHCKSHDLVDHMHSPPRQEDEPVGLPTNSLPANFDLCEECYEKYVRNPLSQDRALKLHFSQN